MQESVRYNQDRKGATKVKLHVYSYISGWNKTWWIFALCIDAMYKWEYSGI